MHLCEAQLVRKNPARKRICVKHSWQEYPARKCICVKHSWQDMPRKKSQEPASVRYMMACMKEKEETTTSILYRRVLNVSSFIDTRKPQQCDRGTLEQMNHDEIRHVWNGLDSKIHLHYLILLVQNCDCACVDLDNMNQ